MDEKGNKPRWYQLDSRSRCNLIVLALGILLYLSLTHADTVKLTMGGFMGVLTPFIVGFAVAYLLNTPTRFFERKVYKNLRLHRSLSILTVYILAFVVIVVLLQMLLPQVLDSISKLAGNLESYFVNFTQLANQVAAYFNIDPTVVSEVIGTYSDMMNSLADAMPKAMPQLLNLGVAIGNGVVTGLTALIVSIYMLVGKQRLLGQIRKLLFAVLPTPKADRVMRVSGRANGIFVGFINGKLVDSAIIGVLCFVLCLIFRIPYAVLVSVIVGVTNVIPFFGPFIGAIPSVMILLIVDPWAALRFGILVIALQQFDGNVLGPKILGDSTGLSAIWVLVAIVVGGGLFGFPGMLLGVPTFAVLYFLVRDWADARLEKKGITADGTPAEQPPETKS